ncbi:phosphatidate cytidylyltransferase [Bosea vestrisii]|uniref:phosphatidate cytidylyltransferase n=1 Tax=Bosea vestrisii TaxID=151416 RepID=UPI0024DFAE00|nr:phosphatidate cytidylyltransferase [Bosea vestrisii]WID97069.1 phosphatidate cytidylyltransferase [Bosea vestrisii]
MNEGSAGTGASELRLRVVSALVLAVVVLGVTLLGGWPFRLIWTVVAGVVAYEWLAIVSRRNAVAGGIGVGLAGLALGFLPLGGPALAGAAALAGLIGAIVTTRATSQRLLEACGVAYALCFALVTPALRDAPGIGLALIIWTFAVVWLTDIAAYFTGRALGGPKLMPSVSPKKTWSGALGGALAGILGGTAVWAFFFPGLPSGVWPVLAVSLAASAASQAGDLFESAIKRRYGTKDSSHLIPGHGGFLDRLDGYWAVLVFAGLLLYLARLGH